MANVTVLDQDARITYTQELITETCISCGVVFALPRSLQAECRKDHDKSFFCPNGPTGCLILKANSSPSQARVTISTTPSVKRSSTASDPEQARPIY